MARVVRPAERAFLLLLADGASAVGGVVLALWTWTFTAGFSFSVEFVAQHAVWFVAVPVWMVALAPTRHAASVLDLKDTFIGIAHAGAVLFVAYVVLFFSIGGDVLPRLVALYVLWDCTWLAVGARLIVLWALTRDQFVRRSLIVGDAASVAAAAALFDQPGLRDAEVIGVVTNDPSATLTATVLGSPQDIDAIAVKHGATDVIVASERELSPELVERLLKCQEAGIDVVAMSQLYELVLRRVPVKQLSSDWLLSQFLGAAGPREASPIAKRLLDLIVALPMAIVGAVIGVFVSAAIVLDSRGPVFYSQIRMGRGGRLFSLTKFRTMRPNAEANGPQWSTKGDPRITRIGRILRRTHLDELPNLWAVLRGDLSMVGPRPERPEFAALLEQQVPFYRVRLTVKPGLTGWAQVNHEYGDSVEDAASKLEYDLYYARHRSVRFDLEIIAHTVGRVLGWRGR